MNIDKEIEKELNSIVKIKKLIPLAIIVGIGFAFVFPIMLYREKYLFIYDFIGFPWINIIDFLIYLLLYFYSYNVAITSKKNKIAKLKKLKKENYITYSQQ